MGENIKSTENSAEDLRKAILRNRRETVGLAHIDAGKIAARAFDQFWDERMAQSYFWRLYSNILRLNHSLLQRLSINRRHAQEVSEKHTAECDKCREVVEGVRYGAGKALFADRLFKGLSAWRCEGGPVAGIRVKTKSRDFVLPAIEQFQNLVSFSLPFGIPHTDRYFELYASSTTGAEEYLIFRGDLDYTQFMRVNTVTQGFCIDGLVQVEVKVNHSSPNEDNAYEVVITITRFNTKK